MTVPSNMQKLVVVVGLVALIIALVYVPFEATYAQSGDNSHADVGYHVIWSPPNPLEVCVKTFGMRVTYLSAVEIVQKANRHCHSKPVFAQVLAVATVVTFATLALFLLAGVIGRRT